MSTFAVEDPASLEVLDHPIPPREHRQPIQTIVELGVAEREGHRRSVGVAGRRKDAP